jgi:predicted phosphoadenosine phosphosulfate sulfurtransferase
MSMVFDEFKHVVVSVSGGKDSSVIRELAIDEACRRGRRVSMFFLDQEAEYASTVSIMRDWMHDTRIDPMWYQVPIRMTNATSHAEYWLRAWWDGEEWMREKDPNAITAIGEKYPTRFYDFFEWMEMRSPTSTAFVVGMRARESLNRHRSTTKVAGYSDWTWSTKTKNPGVFRVYPIYDWFFGDVWKFIADNGISYNTHYDRMFAKHGADEKRMRVSNLIHEQAFQCLADLQEFEPDTYDLLIKRLGGVHAAALYAREKSIYSAGELPDTFPSWLTYRDYLLASTPCDKIDRFRKRFSKQPQDEETYRQQCRQILRNDWENNVPVPNTRKERLREVWWERL